MGVLNYTTAKINELLDKIDKAPEKIENGKTPVFVTGTTTTLDPGLSATAEVVQDGVDENGNPKYKINFGVPKGLDGASGGGGGTADSVQWSNILNMPSWVNSATKPSYTASEVGALPVGTFIPSKLSELTNDSKFLTSADFKTINGQPVVGEGNIQIEGGSSGGGTGNVNVTNASNLKSSEFYAFKPSSDGSISGEFLQMPLASSSGNGLLSKEVYAKISSMKQCVYLPVAFEQVNSSTTKENIVEFFKIALQMPDLNFEGLVIVLQTFCALSNYEGSGDNAKFYIGNNDCLFRGLYTEAENKLLTEFTFITIGGSLKTISILFSNMQSDFSTVEMSISIIQSDDSYFYLPLTVYNLSVVDPKEKIVEAFGGEEGIAALKDAMSANKKIYIKLTSKPDVLNSLIPVSYGYFLGDMWGISFTVPKWGTSKGCITKHIRHSEVLEIYQDGYRLSSNFYPLTSSSSSDDISRAVGGESGLKKLVALIKCGNRILIDSSTNLNQFTPLLPNVITEEENGNIGVLLFGIGYALWGSLGGSCELSYEKSTNTFKVEITPLFAGS